MDWIIAIVVGAIIGWIASLIMKTREGTIAHILIGIVGSALGRWLFADVLGIGGATNAGSFSLTGLLWGIVGAVVLIALLKFFHLLGSDNGVQ